MFLHNDMELFREVIETASVKMNIPVPIVEKDYYVTMILQQLARKAPSCVFKGGTALSKSFHMIDRFSEDIDISFPDRLIQGQRKYLKNKTIASISEELGLPISDWGDTRSRRDYNCYTFSYEPLEEIVPDSLVQGIKMEVSLGLTSFPAVSLPVDSYVWQFLQEENDDLINEFGLQPFEMILQSIERTLVDKVFALCDYYMNGKIKRNSRHIYDIYMILPRVVQNEELKTLIHEVRVHRLKMNICPSAKKGVDISRLLKQIIEEEVYLRDYREVTMHFLTRTVPYEEAIKAIKTISLSGLFVDKDFS